MAMRCRCIASLVGSIDSAADERSWRWLRLTRTTVEERLLMLLDAAVLFDECCAARAMLVLFAAAIIVAAVFARAASKTRAWIFAEKVNGKDPILPGSEVHSTGSSSSGSIRPS